MEQTDDKKLDIPADPCLIGANFKVTIKEWVRDQIKMQRGYEPEIGGKVIIKVVDYIPPESKEI